ncbi:MAG: NAD(P)/FAD-dependent oxidoreductase [Actinomycetes bacterium]
MLRGVVGHQSAADHVRFDLAGDVSVTATIAIAAPGMEWRRLDVPGLEELLERGVYYGAGRSEASHSLIDVRLRSRLTRVDADGGRLSRVTITGATGNTDQRPARAMFVCIGGVPRTAWAAGAGVWTDPRGFILTGPDLLQEGRRPSGWPLHRDPFTLETSVPGFFAASDVRSGSTKRVAGALG